MGSALAKAGNLGGTASFPKRDLVGFGWFGIFINPGGNTNCLLKEKLEEYSS